VDLEQRLTEAREHDALTWTALMDNGMVDGSSLDVDTFFYADNEPSARALASALGRAGHPASVEAHQERSGLFRKKTIWSVQSTATITAASLDSVSDHSERMIRVAEDTAARYDGWGAQVPGS
jgi:hypothetical protein